MPLLAHRPTRLNPVILEGGLAWNQSNLGGPILDATPPFFQCLTACKRKADGTPTKFIAELPCGPRLFVGVAAKGDGSYHRGCQLQCIILVCASVASTWFSSPTVPRPAIATRKRLWYYHRPSQKRNPAQRAAGRSKNESLRRYKAA